MRKIAVILVVLVAYAVDTRSILPREKYNNILLDISQNRIEKIEIKYCHKIYIGVPIDVGVFEALFDYKDALKDACIVVDISESILLHDENDRNDPQQLFKKDSLFRKFENELISTFVFGMPAFHAYGIPLPQPMASVRGAVVFYLKGGYAANVLYFTENGFEGAVAHRRKIEEKWVLEDVKYVFFVNGFYDFVFNQFIKDALDGTRK